MSRRREQRTAQAEDYLADVAAITIKLENGEEVELDIASETYVPTDSEELAEAARRSPAKLAFWAYQTERALEDLRRQEQHLVQYEGRNYDLYRVYFTDEQAVDPTEAMIRAKLDQDSEVRRWRLALRRRRREYGLLRAVRDAVDRRDSVLRTLLHRYEP